MKVVSLAPSNTEILYRLGAQEQIVATTSLCDYPREAIKKPSIGGWSKGVDFKTIAELEPDAALASDELQDPVVEELRNRGVEVVQVKPHSMQEVYDSIKRIGELLGKEVEADTTVKEMKEGFDELEKVDARVYCEEWSEPPMVSGNWIPGVMEAVGAEYPVEEGKRSREIAVEELEDFDPEYIFLNVCGAGTSVEETRVLSRDGWSGLEAVRENRVYRIDDALLNRPGPRLVRGAERIVSIIRSNQ